MNMTYIEALAAYRQEVNLKFPPLMSGGKVTRRTQQIQGGYRGRGCGCRGRGARGGRGRGRNTSRGGERSANGRHLNSYPVTCMDSTVIDVHVQSRITHDCMEYKHQKSQSTMASLNTQGYGNSMAIVP